MDKLECHLLRVIDLVKTVSYVPGTVLGTGNRKMNKSHFLPLSNPHPPYHHHQVLIVWDTETLFQLDMLKPHYRTMMGQWNYPCFERNLLTGAEAFVKVCKGKQSFNYVFHVKEIGRQVMEAGSNLQYREVLSSWVLIINEAWSMK